jgi:hypothetical protein
VKQDMTRAAGRQQDAGKWPDEALLDTRFVASRRLLGSLRQSWKCGLRGRDFSPIPPHRQAATPVANAVLSGIAPNIMAVVGGKGGLNKAIFFEGAH